LARVHDLKRAPRLHVAEEKEGDYDEEEKGKRSYI
jgi:hypothetical protein